MLDKDIKDFMVESAQTSTSDSGVPTTDILHSIQERLRDLRKMLYEQNLIGNDSSVGNNQQEGSEGITNTFKMRKRKLRRQTKSYLNKIHTTELVANIYKKTHGDQTAEKIARTLKLLCYHLQMDILPILEMMKPGEQMDGKEINLFALVSEALDDVEEHHSNLGLVLSLTMGEHRIVSGLKLLQQAVAVRHDLLTRAKVVSIRLQATLSTNAQPPSNSTNNENINLQNTNTAVLESVLAEIQNDILGSLYTMSMDNVGNIDDDIENLSQIEEKVHRIEVICDKYCMVSELGSTSTLWDTDYNNENMDHVLTVFREEIARRTITDIEKAGTLYRKAKSVILNNANRMNDVVVMSTVKMVKSLREQLKETVLDILREICVRVPPPAVDATLRSLRCVEGAVEAVESMFTQIEGIVNTYNKVSDMSTKCSSLSARAKQIINNLTDIELNMTRNLALDEDFRTEILKITSSLRKQVENIIVPELKALQTSYFSGNRRDEIKYIDYKRALDHVDMIDIRLHDVLFHLKNSESSSPMKDIELEVLCLHKSYLIATTNIYLTAVKSVTTDVQIMDDSVTNLKSVETGTQMIDDSEMTVKNKTLNLLSETEDQLGDYLETLSDIHCEGDVMRMSKTDIKAVFEDVEDSLKDIVQIYGHVRAIVIAHSLPLGGGHVKKVQKRSVNSRVLSKAHLASLTDEVTLYLTIVRSTTAQINLLDWSQTIKDHMKASVSSIEDILSAIHDYLHTLHREDSQDSVRVDEFYSNMVQLLDEVEVLYLHIYHAVLSGLKLSSEMLFHADEYTQEYATKIKLYLTLLSGAYLKHIQSTKVQIQNSNHWKEFSKRAFISLFNHLEEDLVHDIIPSLEDLNTNLREELGVGEVDELKRIGSELQNVAVLYEQMRESFTWNLGRLHDNGVANETGNHHTVNDGEHLTKENLLELTNAYLTRVNVMILYINTSNTIKSDSKSSTLAVLSSLKERLKGDLLEILHHLNIHRENHRNVLLAIEHTLQVAESVLDHIDKSVQFQQAMDPEYKNVSGSIIKDDEQRDLRDEERPEVEEKHYDTVLTLGKKGAQKAEATAGAEDDADYIMKLDLYNKTKLRDNKFLIKYKSQVRYKDQGVYAVKGGVEESIKFSTAVIHLVQEHHQFVFVPLEPINKDTNALRNVSVDTLLSIQAKVEELIKKVISIRRTYLGKKGSSDKAKKLHTGDDSTNLPAEANPKYGKLVRSKQTQDQIEPARINKSHTQSGHEDTIARYELEGTELTAELLMALSPVLVLLAVSCSLIFAIFYVYYLIQAKRTRKKLRAQIKAGVDKDKVVVDEEEERLLLSDKEDDDESSSSSETDSDEGNDTGNNRNGALDNAEDSVDSDDDVF